MRPLRTIEPAVTCSVQSTFTTGTLPRDHGCVGNGWYFRDLAEVWLWRQSNHLVAGEKIWDAAKKRAAAFTCAKLFWWFNMYSSADFAVTPRPLYPADGRKIPDIYTEPSDLRDELTSRLGAFPLFHFWGPKADLRSSRWIADAPMRVLGRQKPTLSLVYLPHLDYNLQRLGPNHPEIAKDLRSIDALCGELIEQAQKDGARVIVLSEYGIDEVHDAVFINRVLREAGLLPCGARTLGTDKLDAGASEAFAVADHQVAHVYVRRRERIAEVGALLRAQSTASRPCWTRRANARPGSTTPARESSWPSPRKRSLVLVLLLARRRARARLRAHSRYSSQARVRPRRALRRSVASHSAASRGAALAAEDVGLSVPHGCHSARYEVGQRVPRTNRRRLGEVAGAPFDGSVAPPRAKHVHAVEVKDLVLRHLFFRLTQVPRTLLTPTLSSLARPTWRHRRSASPRSRS